MARKEIRNFLLVLGSGVLAALLGVFWLVRVDGYDKGFYVKEILLSPENMVSNKVYQVESIDYSYFKNGKWDMTGVEKGPYETLWKTLAGDRGSLHPDPEIVKLFEGAKVSTLAIYIRKEVPYQTEGLNELFQQLQVPLTGDYYRVQAQGSWIYFYHPGIQKELSKVTSHG